MGAVYRLRSPDDNVSRLIKDWKVRDSAGVVQTIVQGRVRDGGGVSRVFYSSLAVTLNPGLVPQNHTYKGSFTYPQTINGGWINMYPVGGKPPYTYAWELVSGSALIAPLTPTAANTIFSSTFNAPGARDAVYRPKVTDSLGTIAYGPLAGPDATVSYHMEIGP